MTSQNSTKKLCHGCGEIFYPVYTCEKCKLSKHMRKNFVRGFGRGRFPSETPTTMYKNSYKGLNPGLTDGKRGLVGLRDGSDSGYGSYSEYGSFVDGISHVNTSRPYPLSNSARGRPIINDLSGFDREHVMPPKNIRPPINHRPPYDVLPQYTERWNEIEYDQPINRRTQAINSGWERDNRGCGRAHKMIDDIMLPQLLEQGKDQCQAKKCGWERDIIRYNRAHKLIDDELPRKDQSSSGSTSTSTSKSSVAPLSQYKGPVESASHMYKGPYKKMTSQRLINSNTKRWNPSITREFEKLNPKRSSGRDRLDNSWTNNSWRQYKNYQL